MKRFYSAVAAAAVFTVSAIAQAPSVAIVAAASASITDCRYTEVQSYLLATGQFSAVDVLDAVAATPTLADLTPYDAVLSWTNTNLQDAVLLGDTMADYVDAGGGVVIAVFGTTSTSAARFLGGRWITGGYEVIQAGQGNLGTSASLGSILDPAHPSIQGVNTLMAVGAFRPLLSTSLVQGSVVAEWNDGTILVAQGAMSNRIDLGLYPPTSNCASTFWDVQGDGDILIANSLVAVSGGGSLGMSYCMANPGSGGAVAELSATGSREVVLNDLTLHASSLPSNAFAFFLTGQMQGFVANPGGSAGNLCLGGAIGRYVGPGQIQMASGAGEISLSLNLSMTPQPTGFVAIQAGESWSFQAWYRDASGGMSTSNFTRGDEILFE